MKIQKLAINGKDVRVENLVIIVGPNGVGKTTFLRDLHDTFVTSSPGTVTTTQSTKWTGVFISDSFHSTLTEWKEWAASLKEVSGNAIGNNQKAHAITSYLGRENKQHYLYADLLPNLKASLENPAITPGALEGTLGAPFRDQHSIFLGVDNRFFVSTNFTGQLNPDSTHDTKPAPFLANNQEILQKINRAMLSLFDRKLFVESPTYPTFNILVAKEKVLAPKRLSMTPKNIINQRADYENWIAKNSITTLPEEGHGVRAAMEILYALETENNRIVFIDEPELHLYPSSKYLIGRIIGKYAASGKKQIILTTHDSDLLRGLLHGSSKSTVLRINKDRTIKSVTGHSLKKTSGNEVLQSAFLDAVILTEGIGDQFVYRNVFQQKHLLEKISYQVIAVNGKESIADDIPFFNDLNIMYAVILDYDSIFSDKRGGLINYCLVKTGADEQQLEKAAQLVRDITQFSKDMGGKRKGLGNTTLTLEQKSKIVELLNLLKKYGVFIVPCGELEDWVNGSKPIIPEKVYSVYKSSANKKYKGLSDFANKISKYIIESLK